MLIGADGSALFSVSANKGATITLRLMHTSPTHRLLTQKLKRQQALASPNAAFPVTVYDIERRGWHCRQVLHTDRPE